MSSHCRDKLTCLGGARKLTFAVASMFSGSTRVRSRPISCTAPPSSGSVSQIMCSMIRLIRRMSCKANNQSVLTHKSFCHISDWLCWWTHVIILLRLLHDELSYHGGVVLHQIRENICGCPTHLNVIHSLFHEHEIYSSVDCESPLIDQKKSCIIFKKKQGGGGWSKTDTNAFNFTNNCFCMFSS